MAVKRGRAAAPPPEDFATEVPAAELVGLVDELDIARKLEQWAIRENPENQSYLTYLYKFDHPSTGDAKVLCTRYENEIPDPHNIGIQFGSGRYLVLVSIPATPSHDSKVKALRVRLGPQYDSLKKQAEAGMLPGAPVPGAHAPGSSPYVMAAQAQGVNNLSQGLELVERVMGMILPLVAAQQSSKPDMSAVMRGQYDLVSSMMKRSLMDQQDMAKEVIRARIESGSTEDEDEDREQSMLEKLLPLIEKFLPMITAGGVQGQTTAAMVRQLPQFAEVVGNRAELLRIINYLDTTQGPEQTDALLKALKIARPGKSSPSRVRRNGRTHAPVAARATG